MNDFAGSLGLEHPFGTIQNDSVTLCLPKISSAQVERLFGFGGCCIGWLLPEGPLAAA
jgi:hypothetical protein